MKTDINDLLEPKDKIWLIQYYDHAVARENIEDVRKKPFILWCIGKILNLDDTEDNYYFLVNSGRLYRIQPPLEYQVIFKKAIIKKEVIYVIPTELN